MMGRVLVEGTREPVPDATVRVAVGGKAGDFLAYEFRAATSDEHGNFDVLLGNS